MTTGDGLAFLAVALILASFAGCEAVDSIQRHQIKPQPSVEQICAGQWFPSDYCKALTLKKS